MSRSALLPGFTVAPEPESTLANCFAPLRFALLLDLPYGWATSGTSGTLLRSSLVSCGWWQPFGHRNLTFAGYYVDLLDFLRICLVGAAW